MPQLFTTVFSSDFSQFPKKTTPFDDVAVRQRLITHVTKLPGFANCRILYIGKNTNVEIRPFPAQFSGKGITVAIRPITGGNKQVNEEINPLFSDSQKDERFYNELANAGFNCGAAIISIVVAGFGVAAAPASGGTSLFLTNLASASAAATGLQCLNSAYRLYNETSFGDDMQMNRWLDSQAWYTTINYTLDGISVAGAGAQLKTVFKSLNIITKASTRKVNTSVLQVLKGLDNKARKKLTMAIIKNQNRGLSNNKIKLLMRAQKIPKGYSSLNLNYTLRTQLIEALGSSLSITGSLKSGGVKKTGILAMQGGKYIINVIEEMNVN